MARFSFAPNGSRWWRVIPPAGLLLIGCATTSSWYMVFQDLNIVAKPPGARIMIGDDNIGRAPLTIRYRRGGEQGQAKSMTIRAMANGAGECNQTRVIPPEERTPRVIYFDMAACPGPD